MIEHFSLPGSIQQYDKYHIHQTILERSLSRYVIAFFFPSIVSFVLVLSLGSWACVIECSLQSNISLIIFLWIAGLYWIIVLIFSFDCLIDFKHSVITSTVRFCYIPIKRSTYHFDSIKDIWICLTKGETSIGTSGSSETSGREAAIYFKLHLFCKLGEKWELINTFSFLYKQDHLEKVLVIYRLLQLLPNPEILRNLIALFSNPADFKSFKKEFYSEIKTYLNSYFIFESFPPSGLEGRFKNLPKRYSYYFNDQVIMVKEKLSSMKQILDAPFQREQKCYRAVFANNVISEISPVDYLKDVTDLDLSNNKISKIQNLESYPNLRRLDLSHNNITRIENIGCLAYLEELWICSNTIDQIEGLDNLPNLRRLYLSDNRITGIKNLDSLKNLEVLCLDRNQITRIENIGNLPNLERLNLWNNKVTSREGLSTCPSLKVVYLQGNPIS